MFLYMLKLYHGMGIRMVERGKMVLGVIPGGTGTPAPEITVNKVQDPGRHCGYKHHMPDDPYVIRG